MDCPEAKSGEVAVACPPDDSLVEIFSRLPAKPLFRFKCVSKDWCGLITDRLRCRKLPQTLEGFLARKTDDDFGTCIFSERPVPLVETCFSFLTELPEIEKIVLLDSCNGLVLFEHRQVISDSDSQPGDSDDEECFHCSYIVCNPATEEWVSVPGPDYTPEVWDPDRTFLIFDPATSPHFQLIHLRLVFMFDLEEVRIFSSVTGAWRQELDGAPSHTVVTIGQCFFDGMLHVGARQPSSIIPSEDKHLILAVGGEGRPFRTLHWPQNDRGIICFVGQSQGHLHCVSAFRTKDFEMTELFIWVLDDYNAEKWVLRNNVSLAQLFKRMKGRFLMEWSVVGIHPDRGLVFFAEYWNRKLISYDMDKKEVHAVFSLHGYQSYHRCIIPYLPYFAQSAVFANNF